MGVKDKPPASRPRFIANLLFAIAGLFLLSNLLFPMLFGNPTPQVPYSLFIDQVEDGNVARASVGQKEIIYELKESEIGQPKILRTNPILDLELPKRLEDKGVEFAAAPPPQNNWIGSILSWVIPPLIFVGIWQFFLGRGIGGGGPQGALSITKSKAKVYVHTDKDALYEIDVRSGAKREFSIK